MEMSLAMTPALANRQDLAVRRFNDDLMEVHLGSTEPLPLALLLACFAAPTVDDDGTLLEVEPCPRCPHPEGRLCYRGEAGRAVAVAPHGVLRFGGTWEARYKMVLCGDRIAIRLGFAAAGPTVGSGDDDRLVACLILDRGGIAIGVDSGLLELGA